MKKDNLIYIPKNFKPKSIIREINDLSWDKNIPIMKKIELKLIKEFIQSIQVLWDNDGTIEQFNELYKLINQ